MAMRVRADDKIQIGDTREVLEAVVPKSNTAGGHRAEIQYCLEAVVLKSNIDLRLSTAMIMPIVIWSDRSVMGVPLWRQMT